MRVKRCGGLLKLDPHKWREYSSNPLAYARKCSKCGLMQIPQPETAGVHWIDATKAEFEINLERFFKEKSRLKELREREKQIEKDRDSKEGCSWFPAETAGKFMCLMFSSRLL